MPLFHELKRRNVFRAAGLYLVGAWLVVQVASTLLPIFHTPEWVLQALVVLLAIGFVPALAFAWVFEVTPEGLRREQDLPAGAAPDPTVARRMDRALIVVLVLALAAFAIERFVLPVAKAPPSPVAAPPRTPTAAPAPAVNPKSIAVLPFANLSDDKANEYFVSGMQDVILTKLSEIGELHVASRTSTERYADQRPGLRDIARTLQVAYLLEGSVQKAGNQVLINVQLVDGRTDAHLWAQSYKRTLDDIFGVEGEVAQLVAEALHAELSAAEAAALAAVATTNKEALDAYLRGRHALRQSNRSLDPADLDEAIVLARRAVTLDPRYADAWALLALAHFKRGGPNAAANAESAARRALAIDPDHYGGHVQLGFALSSRGKHEEAIAHGREAVRLRPSELSAQTGLAIMLAYAGQRDEAARVFAHAIRLDPQSAFPANWQAALLLSGRDYAAARKLAGTLVARDPADLWSLSLLVRSQLDGDGDFAAARASLRRAPTTPAQSAALAELWWELEWLARDFAAARRVLALAQGAAATDPTRLLALARVHAAQGEGEAARASARQARAVLEDRANASPQDAPYQRQLARALSLSGEHDLAMRAAERALALQSPANNAVEGPASLLTLAQVHLRAGRRAEAVEYLRSLMALPAGTFLSARRLRMDPEWDALRGTPEFEALLREYPVPP